MKRLAPLAFAVLVAGCGRAPATPYEVAFARGERAETAGRFADAASGYDAASKIAPNERERAHAEFASAEMSIRAGDRATGAAKLRKLAAATPPGEHTAEATYRIASLEIAENDAQGWLELEHAMAKFPNDGLAHRSLQRLSAHVEETSGKGAAIRWLERVAPSFAGTELEQAVAYETAKRVEASGDLVGARARYLAIADKWPYPHGAFWDDSLYEMAVIDEGAGRYAEAIADLNRMLADRETASMIGSYERPKYEPAAWKIAVIQRDKLHDANAARAAFHRIYTDFTTSLRRDDALWEESQIVRTSADGADACGPLSTLVSMFPDSRYVPCALAACPAISRPSKSVAPKRCPPYLSKTSRNAAD